MAKLRVIIIDENDKSRHQISQALLSYSGNVEVLAETDSLVYGYELIRQNRPDIVFVDFREDRNKTLETMRRISTYFKEVMIIASGEDISLDIIRASMQAGAREYLQRPLKDTDIHGVLNQYRDVLTVDNVSGDKTGRIVTVFSNKGGLGKTTIAVNLAIALSQTTRKPVALVDLNLQLGDITTFLDISPKQTIVDIAKNIGRVDAAYLESSLAEFKYGDAQLFVLADPLHAEDAEEVTSEQINAVLTVLKATFEYVVIDTTTSFDAKTLTSLDLADTILLVGMINLPCIRSSQRLLGLFERLEYDSQKVKLLINRHMPGEEITVEDVEDTLEHEVYWKIPNQYNVVMNAINRGIPITAVETGNKAEIENSFVGLARKITGILTPGQAISNTVVQESKKALGLGGLFGKK